MRSTYSTYFTENNYMDKYKQYIIVCILYTRIYTLNLNFKLIILADRFT